MQLSQGSERTPFAGVRLAGSVEVGTIRRERASGAHCCGFTQKLAEVKSKTSDRTVSAKRLTLRRQGLATRSH